MNPDKLSSCISMLLHILVLTVAAAVVEPALVAPEPHDADDTDAMVAPNDDAAALTEATEMVSPDEIPDASTTLSEDVDRWVLQDVLQMQQGAQSLDWRQHYTDTQAASPHKDDSSTWQEDLVQARLHGMLRGQPEQHHQIDTQALAFDIPLAAHPLVDLYIEYFTGRGRAMFERWLTRASLYIPMMQKILAAHQVPEDLVYLAMIESGFSAQAYSSASATGYWQFMASTGKLYGLKQTHWIDERRDFIRSTEAAATYLHQLHRTLGDWHLAWASYNAGEGRVRRALSRHKETNFWQLIEHPKSLAKETMHYVPKVIAAALVAKDAERYGFNIPEVAPLRYQQIPIQGAIDLRLLAQRGNIPITTLRQLNPALLHDITPPDTTTQLRVPEDHKDNIVALLDKMPQNQRMTYWVHRVQRGDTLSGIAHRFGTSVATLRAFNHFKSPLLRLGQSITVPMLPNKAPTRVASSTRIRKRRQPTQLSMRQRRASTSHNSNVRRHVVAAGDTLWNIARRYNVSMDRIRGHVSPNRLAIGDVLEIL